VVAAEVRLVALPAPFTAALALPGVSVETWVEVEGLPWAFGMRSRDASFFGGRAAAQRRLGVAPVLLTVPRGAEQEARPLEAESSVGQITVALQLDAAGTVLPLIANGARKDQQVRLSADMDATSAVGTITFTGDASAWPSSGVAYLGRESFTYTGKTGTTLTGCGRAAFALPNMEARQAHTAGDLLSPYPRFVATRRAAWFTSLDGTDANKVCRWAGTVRGAKLASGGAGVDLTLESLDGDLKIAILATQRTGKLGVGVTGEGGGYSPASDAEAPASSTRLVLLEGTTTGVWTAGEPIIVRLGDEYIAGVIAVDDTERSITITGRTCFASKLVQHVPGDDLREVMWTGVTVAGGTPQEVASRFVGGDHPIEVCLQLLTSRKGDGANGIYDTLPEGWGAGIDAARIDIAGALDLKAKWFNNARHLWVYEEPTDLKTLLAEILRPHGAYLVTTLNDLLTFRRLSPVVPGDALREVTAAGIVAVPTWDANIADVVGRTIWRCDYDPLTGDPRQAFIGEMQGPGTEAQEFYTGLWRTLEVEGRGQFTGNDSGSAFFGSGLSTNAQDSAQRYFELVRDRYARPFPMIGVECSFDYLDVEVGDLVKLTVSNLPDVTVGAMGLLDAVCEVLRKAIDDLRGVVSLTLLHTTTSLQHRLLAPAMRIGSWGMVGPPYSIGVGGTATGEFFQKFGDGAKPGTTGFQVGQVVEMWSGDLKTLRGTRTITAVTDTDVFHEGALLQPVSMDYFTGDLLIVAGYASQPAAERERHAYAASDTDLLNGTDPAHTYAT
jgi:hypothetical protein